MKKKLFVLLTLLFSVVLIAASATACGKKSNNSETSSEFASESIPNSTPESSFDSSVDMTPTLILSADSLQATSIVKKYIIEYLPEYQIPVFLK